MRSWTDRRSDLQMCLPSWFSRLSLSIGEWKGESGWQDWQVWLDSGGGRRRWISASPSRRRSSPSCISLSPCWHCCCCYCCHCCCCYYYCCYCSGCCCLLWLSLSQKLTSRMWAGWNVQNIIHWIMIVFYKMGNLTWICGKRHNCTFSCIRPSPPRKWSQQSFQIS